MGGGGGWKHGLGRCAPGIGIVARTPSRRGGGPLGVMCASTEASGDGAGGGGVSVRSDLMIQTAPGDQPACAMQTDDKPPRLQLRPILVDRKSSHPPF